MEALKIMYEFTFRVFRTAEFSWPSIGLDFTLLEGALGYLADLGDIDAFDATHFLEGSEAMSVLSNVLSLVKTGIAVTSAAFTFFEQFGVLPNVQFNECALWDMGRENIAKKMDELLAKVKTNQVAPES